MATNVAVIFYSATGNVHMLAEAIAEGAGGTGAEVRLKRVAELASEEAIQQNPLWAKYRDETAGTVEDATLDDLEWADGFAFGTPVRFGNPAAQLKQYLDMAGPRWFQGALADKPVTSFTSAMYPDGGLESTILAVNTSSTAGAACSCRRATPTRSSARRAAILTEPPSPQAAAGRRRPFRRRPGTRAGASRRSPRRSSRRAYVGRWPPPPS
jgi:NADPH-dependent FMN reductase